MDSLQEQNCEIINRMQSERPDFSFNDKQTLQQKYVSLGNQLKKLQSSDLIQLVIDEIEENQKNKHQILCLSLKIKQLEDNLTELSNQLQRKKQAIVLLCKSQSKNINLIEKLERKLISPLDIDKQSYFERKYRELSMYMGEYINNINEAQSQFKRRYYCLKNQNKRLNMQIQKNNSQSIQLLKKNQILTHNLNKNDKVLKDLTQGRKKLLNQIDCLEEQNQKLKKEIENCQENMKIVDRIQSRSDNQISSELEFIREKLNENQNISRQIIVKYQEKQQAYNQTEHLNMDLQSKCNQLISINKQLNQKINELYLENITIRNKNQLISQEIDNIDNMLCEKQKQLQDSVKKLKTITIQYEGIKRQSAQLNLQIKNMQNNYKRETHQNQKIKEELQKFWVKKQWKKEEKKQDKKQAFNILRQKNDAKEDSLINSTHDQSNYKNNSIKRRQNKEIRKGNQQNY